MGISRQPGGGRQSVINVILLVLFSWGAIVSMVLEIQDGTFWSFAFRVLWG